jgi:hypothetical protein
VRLRAEFKPKENGLVPIKVVEWGRWIFINIGMARTA